jgi:hypothetical protein
MANIKINIDPEELDKKTTDKFKNYNKVDRKISRFYTIAGLRNMFLKNKLLFVLVFLIWLVTFVWFVAD